MAIVRLPLSHDVYVCWCRLELKSYRTVVGTPDVDLDVVGKTKVGGMDVEVIDPVEVRACARVCVGSI